MTAIVLMKVFEATPSCYEAGMRLITLGEITRIRLAIVRAIGHRADVLDIGCGPGELHHLLEPRHCSITGIDKSANMVRFARKNACATSPQNISIAIEHGTALEIDRAFSDRRFDTIILSFVLTELGPDERTWVVRAAENLLKPAGSLLVIDEFLPESALKRAMFHIARVPIHLTGHVLQHVHDLSTTGLWWRIYYAIVELPLMVLSFFTSEPLTRPIKSLSGLLPDGLYIAKCDQFLGGVIRFATIKKGAPE